jgi:hypothetical protein
MMLWNAMCNFVVHKIFYVTVANACGSKEVLFDNENFNGNYNSKLLR